MADVRIKFLGSGDAFGSGGRLQCCFLLESAKNKMLLECGATSSVALQKQGISPDEINLIVVSNLHGDHFGGIPYFVIDQHLNRKREKPLTIAGPAGVKELFPLVMETTFPGAGQMKLRYMLNLVELDPGQQQVIEGVVINSYPAVHSQGDPHLALRIRIGDQIIAYTGDTEWTDNIAQSAREADLLIAESYFYNKKVKFHMDYETLISHADELGAKRMVLVHMSPDMIGHIADITCEYAEDGKIIDLT